MNNILTIAFMAGAFGAGAAIVWFLRGREIDGLKATLVDVEKSLAIADTRLENVTALEAAMVQARQQISDLTGQNSLLVAKQQAATESHQSQITQLTQLRQEVQDQFELVAGRALSANAEGFLRQATQVFENQKNLTNAAIEERAQQIDQLVKPLGVSLQAYDSALKEIENARIAGFSEIDAALKLVNSQHTEVRNVTAALVNALRASPKTRGRWAEHTLQRVMELSGLVEHCDFETEKHFQGDDESFRPDVVIQIARDRTIIVDAKAPTSAYLDAIEAVSEDEREGHLKRHASQLRERLNNLSGKSYWEKIPGSTDCVIMFVPGDNFVSAAFERDQGLFEDGVKNRVLICTPTTFIALAKAIAYGWRQEKLAANAIEVANLGRELYARLSTMAEHVSLVGKHLKDSVNSYNKFVGSLENRVLPQARRFNELGVEGTSSEIAELTNIDTLTRSLSPEPARLGLLEPDEET